MELKTAKYSDYERIATLHANNWQRYLEGTEFELKDSQDVLDDRIAIWQTRLINPSFNQHVLLLEEGGLLCGFICAFGNHDVEKGTYIDSLHIDPHYQGKGLSITLLQALSEWMRSYYPDSGAYLEIFEANGNAINFYKHLGAEKVGARLWHAPWNQDVNEVIYCWDSFKSLEIGLM